MQSYESAVKLHDKDRQLAATAIFRLGECYRKQGKTNEANAYYKRVITEFADQSQLVELSRSYVGNIASNNSDSFVERARQNFRGNTADSKTLRQSTENDVLGANLRSVQLETAQAEALWKHVRGLGGEELVNFFTTIQPDQFVIDLDRERVQAESKLEALGTQVGKQHPEYKAQEKLTETATKRLHDRAHTVAWGIEEKYKMLKEQEDSLKARLDQSSGSVANAKESPTTSEEDEEIRKIKEMIQNSPDLINARSESGFTPLQSAAAAGHLKVVQYLINSGAEINPGGMTPLMYAALNGHNAVVEFLLSKGANVNATTDVGRTALHYAAQHGFKIVVETLLKHGANVNARENDGKTAVWSVADNGSKPILELLLANGADVNLNAADSSPLLRAVGKKHVDCVEVLVAHKSDVNFKTPHGSTPLLTAADNNDLASAKILLDNGADTEAQIPAEHLSGGFGYVPNRETASFRAINIAIGKDAPKFVELLLEHLADPNSKMTWYHGDNSSTAGTTPLIMAVRLDKPAVVEVLLKHGAQVSWADGSGMTALHYAARLSKTNLAEILLLHDADVNAPDKNHQTPLFYAVSQSKPDTNMVALLIGHHADVNVADAKGYPPIFWVMATPSTPERQAVREQLLKAGANENFVRLKQISVRRNDHDTVIFTKGSNDWNHFTLYELISVVYGRNQYPSGGVPGFRPVFSSIPTMPIPSSGVTPYAAIPAPPRMGGGHTPADLPFPDFTRLVIKRIGANPLERLNRVRETALNTAAPGEEKSYKIDLENLLQSPDRGDDIQLEWGDIVEIPEQDHPINATWEGLSGETQRKLMQLLSRTIEIKIKGQATNITVLPPMPNYSTTGMWRLLNRVESKKPLDNVVVCPFGLRSVVNELGVLRSSSDTAHIKVIRQDNAGMRSITVDLHNSEEPWIEPGDVLEIPDRESASAPAQVGQ